MPSNICLTLMLLSLPLSMLTFIEGTYAFETFVLFDTKKKAEKGKAVNAEP